MWELDHKESWAPKKWCYCTSVGEDSWESLGLQGESTSQSSRKSVLNIHRRTDAKAETPILWPPDVKNWLIGKYTDAGQDWRQEEKRMPEDEMIGWHHRLDGHEFEHAPGVGDGQGSLVCCRSWGCRVRHNWATQVNCYLLGKNSISRQSSGHQGCLSLLR